MSETTYFMLDHIVDAVRRATGAEPEVGFAGIGPADRGPKATSLWVRLTDGSGRCVLVGDLEDPLVARGPVAGRFVEPSGFTVQTYACEADLENGAEYIHSSQTSANLFDLVDEIRRHVYEARGARSYCQGLPVSFTVFSDGRVAYEVDLSDIDLTEDGVAAQDEDGEPLYTDEQIEADQEAIEAWLAREHGMRRA